MPQLKTLAIDYLFAPTHLNCLGAVANTLESLYVSVYAQASSNLSYELAAMP